MAARFPVKKKRTRGELHVRERERRKGKEQGRKGAGHGLIRWWWLRSLAAAMGSWLGHWLAIGSREKETGSRGSGWCGGESEEGLWIGEEEDWIWIPRKNMVGGGGSARQSP